MSDLNRALLRAHATDDKPSLVQLYTQAADQATDVDAACFYLTHAYVFALEIDDAAVDALHARLAAEGRV